jgi:hypothetical protein
MAQDVRLFYGSRSSSDVRIFDPPYISENKFGEYALGMRIRELQHIRQQLQAFKKETSPDLGIMDALKITAWGDASDNRDYIFSTRAFIREEDAALIQPDYTLADWQVFSRATFAMMITTDNINCLFYKSFDSDTHLEGLTSWAVEYKNFKDTWLGRPAVPSLKGHCRHDPTMSMPLARIDSSSRYLTLYGLVFDSIVDVKLHSPLFSSTAQPVSELVGACLETLKAKQKLLDATWNTRMPAAFSVCQHRWCGGSSVASRHKAIGNTKDSIDEVRSIDSPHPWLRHISEMWRGRQPLGYCHSHFDALERYQVNRRYDSKSASIFSMSSNLLGYTSTCVVTGDHVCRLYGSDYYVVLRQEGQYYTFKAFATIFAFEHYSVDDILEISGRKLEEFTLQ